MKKTKLYKKERDFRRKLMADIDEPRIVDSFMLPARRDFSRVIYSPSFRRLQGKSQLFPAFPNNPFYRNRLTHSIEVSNIAATIAAFLNRRDEEMLKRNWAIDVDVVAMAGLAHDLGHPPFGHTGEQALQAQMAGSGGFEGNAQSFRILSTLEKRLSLYHEHNSIRNLSGFIRENAGLNLAFRSLASVLKYDKIVDTDRTGDVEFQGVSNAKGYYDEDKDLISLVKEYVLRKQSSKNRRLYTIECQIMDYADDVAYSTFDLEDCLKAEFLHPLDFFSTSRQVQVEKITSNVNEGLQKRGINEDVDPETVVAVLMHIFSNMFEPSKLSNYDLSDRNVDRALFASLTYQEGIELSRTSFLRREFSIQRIHNAIEAVSIIPDDDEPSLSKLKVDDEIALEIECLKAYNFEMVISSPQLSILEYRGRAIVDELFEIILNDNKLLPLDLQEYVSIVVSEGIDNETSAVSRTVCDFIAGMTDYNAIQFYAKLKGVDQTSLFELRDYN